MRFCRDIVKMGRADALRLCKKKENGTDGYDCVEIVKMRRADTIMNKNSENGTRADTINKNSETGTCGYISILYFNLKCLAFLP